MEHSLTIISQMRDCVLDLLLEGSKYHKPLFKQEIVCYMFFNCDNYGFRRRVPRLCIPRANITDLRFWGVLHRKPQTLDYLLLLCT